MSAFYCGMSWLQKPPPSSPSNGEDRLRISAAHDEWNHNLQALVAMEKGYLRDEGLEDVELFAFADDEAAQIEALTSGRVDVALDPMIQRVLVAQNQGADIHIVAPRRKMHSFVIVGQKWMKSVEDLRGQTVHVGKEGEATQQLRKVLRMAGLEWGKDVKIVPRPHTNMHDLEGFRRSFVAGETLTVNVHPWEAEEWSRKGYPILADTSKLFPPRQDRVVTASGRLVREKADVLKCFLKAYIRASRFIVDQANVEEIRGILERAGFLDNEVDRLNFPRVMEGQWYRLSPDGRLPIEGVEQALKEQKEAGTISGQLSLGKVLKVEALHQAQRELGIDPTRA